IIVVVLLLVLVLAGAMAAGAVRDPRAVAQSAPVLLVTTMAIYAVIWLATVRFTVHKYRLPWSALGYRPRPMTMLLTCAGLALPTLVLTMLVNLAIANLLLHGEFPNPQQEMLQLGQVSPLAGALLLLLLAVV